MISNFFSQKNLGGIDEYILLEELKQANKNMNKKYAVISLSGGMDSGTLLLRLLSEGYEVTALSFDYGQKHKIELERATQLVEYINKILWHKGLGLSYQIKHQIIKLDGLSQLLNSSLVEGGSDVPEGHYASENMKDTVVPNRNMIFSSIVQAVALSIANKNNTECIIALGLHSGDHTIYPDTTEEFRQSCLNTFRIGNWNSELVNYYTPYMEGNKITILQDGIKCCKQLGLNFDEVYKRTNIEIHEEDIQNLKWTLKYCDVSINYLSTMTLESFIFDKTVVNINYPDKYHRGYTFRHYKPIIDAGAVFLPKSFDLLVEDVNKCLKNPNSLKSQRDKVFNDFIYFKDGKSYRRNVDFIEKII
jgi:7-cyano-7-deazaguanine synthase